MNKRKLKSVHRIKTVMVTVSEQTGSRYLEKVLQNSIRRLRRPATEIINLQAILNLPKGTEHFMTDIHGEYEPFHHVLKNGSGSVREKDRGRVSAIP